MRESEGSRFMGAFINADGRLEVFARDTNNALRHKWQTRANNGWSSGWASLGGTLTSPPVVTANNDRRLEADAYGDGESYGKEGCHELMSPRPKFPISPLPDYPGICGWKRDRKSTRLNSSHLGISYAVFCLKKKKMHGHDCEPRELNEHTAPKVL